MAKADIERSAPNPRVAEVMSRHRKMRGMTQDQLARQAGISVWMLYKIENGQRGIGTVSLGRLGKVLGKDFEHEMLGVLAGGVTRKRRGDA